MLGEKAEIAFWLDRQTLTDEGVALDQPITLKLKGVRLESVLHLLLHPVQLEVVPEDDVLVTTTSTKAAEKLITRTYPVRDLYQGRTTRDVGTPPQSNASGPAKKIGILPPQKNDAAAGGDAAASQAKSSESPAEAIKGGDTEGGKGPSISPALHATRPRLRCEWTQPMSRAAVATKNPASAARLRWMAPICPPAREWTQPISISVVATKIPDSAARYDGWPLFAPVISSCAALSMRSRRCLGTDDMGTSLPEHGSENKRIASSTQNVQYLNRAVMKPRYGLPPR